MAEDLSGKADIYCNTEVEEILPREDGLYELAASSDFTSWRQAAVSIFSAPI